MKNDHIKADTQVPGLQEAREKLSYLKMTKEERQAYDRHIENLMIQNDVIDTAREEGLSQGREEGRAEGRAEGLSQGRAEGIAEEKRATARKMKSLGIDHKTIAEITGLLVEEIEKA